MRRTGYGLPERVRLNRVDDLIKREPHACQKQIDAGGSEQMIGSNRQRKSHITEEPENGQAEQKGQSSPMDGKKNRAGQKDTRNQKYAADRKQPDKQPQQHSLVR